MRSSLRSRRPAAWLAGGTLAAFLGCAPSTPPLETDVDTPVVFTVPGESTSPVRWWTVFGDASLDSLVARALRANPDVLVADARLREASARIGFERSAYFPDLRATAGAEVREGEGFDTADEMRLGLDSTVELDLFGSIRSAVEAERLRAAAADAARRAVQLDVAAAVASTWSRLLEARSQVDLLLRQEETNEAVLILLENRFGSGQIRGVDILRQRQLLESTRERAAEERGRVRTLENAMAVLPGRAPGRDLRATGVELPALPPVPRTGAPATLVQRRPDVQRAWLELHAADRDLATAIRRQYPRLDLTASVTTAATGPGGLFEDWIGSLAGNLLAPLFTGGRLDAEVDRTEAIRARRLHEYTRTVLEAFLEVEDALALEEARAERIGRLENQVELARQAYEQLRNQYLNGLGGYLDVLTALTEEQELQRALLTARRARLESRIDLYRALAGPLDES